MVETPQHWKPTDGLLLPLLLFFVCVVVSRYFDTLIKPSGKQEIEFSQFSLDSLAASKRNIEAFLRLVPADQLEAAQSQLDARSLFASGGVSSSGGGGGEEEEGDAASFAPSDVSAGDNGADVPFEVERVGLEGDQGLASPPSGEEDASGALAATAEE